MASIPIGHRIGLGYDLHAFAPASSGRSLVLGGVTIPHPRGLLGHSDADALVHAACDAILGALSLGDLGAHFPDTDPRFKGISSLTLLKACGGMAAERGWRVKNLDSVVIAEAPKIAPFASAMRSKIAEALDVPLEDVSVKGTRPEGLGALGRGEGIACQAIVLLASRGELARLLSRLGRSVRGRIGR